MIAIMPMAGRGSRFANSGYAAPKPLISVDGIPMFARVLESIKQYPISKLIIVSLQEHEDAYAVRNLVSATPFPNAEIILLDGVTDGQLCTVMAAREQINTPEDILVVSSDTIIVSSLPADIKTKKLKTKGIISVANMPGDRWSFAEVDQQEAVVRVSEKIRISDHASTGMYYFSHGNEFCTYATELLKNQERTGGEYYIIPVYQKYINDGHHISLSHATEMWDLGTPESLINYLAQSGGSIEN